ncbi:MAG: hypothetical protein R6W78_04890 [Bacteroidales bacterium]
MKKGNLLKLFTGIAMTLFVANGLFAQVEVADYAAISGAATEIDSVTVGSTTRLYVKPDAYFHPGYVAPGWSLTPGFSWTWTIPGAAGTADAGEATATADVWVQVDWSVTAGGPYEITVTETASAAFGGCTGDTNVWVSVIDSATVAFTSGAGYIDNDTLSVCEGDGSLSNIVQATFTGIRTFQLDWSLEIATLASDKSKELYWSLAKVSLGGTQAYAVEKDGAGGNQEVNINATTFNLSRPTDNTYTAINDGTRKKITLYSYAINGVNDRISRKSDYLNNPTPNTNGWTWYDTTPKTVVIKVNPAPVTGPIYHIPNNWQP